MTDQIDARPLRLLVVDDDAALLKSLSQTLADDGHEIVACDGGQAGIEAFLSPSEAPYQVKAAVAITSTIMLFFYVVVLGYRGGRHAA